MVKVFYGAGAFSLTHYYIYISLFFKEPLLMTGYIIFLLDPRYLYIQREIIFFATNVHIYYVHVIISFYCIFYSVCVCFNNTMSRFLPVYVIGMP